jgi:hypothetical protein
MMATAKKTDAERVGDSRLTKVLLRLPTGEIEGHRGYPVAVHAATRSSVVVAATESKDWADKFTWGRLYLVREIDPEQFSWVMGSAECVPHEEGWELFEALMDDKAGHQDPF